MEQICGLPGENEALTLVRTLDKELEQIYEISE